MTEALYGYLCDISRLALQFGGRVETILFKPVEGKVATVGQDPYGNLLIDSTSKANIPEITVGGCLHKLNHLSTALTVMGDRKLKAGARIEIETRMASDQKTLIVGSFTFVTGRTRAQYVTKDPFRAKAGTKVNRVKINKWPTEFHIDAESVEAFDEAHKVHLSSESASKDDLILLCLENDEIKVRFGEIAAVKSDPKTETVISRKIMGDKSPYRLILSAATFRSTMKVMGPDGGIAKLSDHALSIKSESLHAVYTITLTGKIEEP